MIETRASGGRGTGKGNPDPAAIAALQADPRFAAAAHRCAAALVEHYRDSWLLNRIMNDRGRFVLSVLVLDLHFYGGPDGLTAGGLKTLCVEQNVCSRGRAGAMLAAMRLFGLLTSAAGPDLRRKRLVPTERLLAIHRERWRGALAATGDLIPVAAVAAQRLGDETFFAAFVHALAERYRGGMRPLAWAPALAPFAEHDAGVMILFSIFLTQLDAGQGLSIVKLAQRFSVSRAHVLGVLRGGEAEGLLMREADRRIVLAQPLRQALSDFLAGIFIIHADAAREAVKAGSGAIRADERGGVARPPSTIDRPSP
ncbi:hypothetical protein [Chelatococcus reniformis]|uniref:Uncharacterized protein n=1 Tax=Chelatococcus reniformis TaxID=1494448 RepID=A0A916UGB7_9HYPH|nr:hypothetical protein [Chelatococcus reniformis]GGC71469.1 hypothetical protein GCM10010994_32470 [Chelatococcus reniformis]